ncbi:ORFL28C [Human betaherpesvirus 5]|nr:ORFL28C [Human betaherpesvirus 5]QHX40320.1 ORFL28C [Human betaherpesvirus 5]
MCHACSHAAHCMPIHGGNEGNSTRRSALSGDGVRTQRRLK